MQYKSGSVTGTTAAFSISVGFLPKKVKVVNSNTGANVEWFDSMTAGDGLLAQDHDTAQFSLETSNYITQYTGLAAGGALSGTAAVTAGSATVTGTNTLALIELAVGDSIIINGEQKKIASIASNTSFVCDSVFAASASGKSVLSAHGRAKGFTLGTAANINTAHTLYWYAEG